VDGECLKLYGMLYNHVLITCLCCFVLQKMAREDGQVAPEFADAEEGEISFYAINFLFRCSFWYPKSAFVAYVYLIILISFFVCRKAI
jgi:hypothetical protein